MIEEVFPRISIADMEGCRYLDTNGRQSTKVHACKSPCHQQAVGYAGSLRSDHPHYLHYTVHDPFLSESALFLNLIDPPQPLFKKESFDTFLKYAESAYAHGQSLIIHCNQGRSRAPTLAMMLAAKRLELLPDGTFEEVRAEFEKLYPDYMPGRGIAIWMERNWESIE